MPRLGGAGIVRRAMRRWSAAGFLPALHSIPGSGGGFTGDVFRRIRHRLPRCSGISGGRRLRAFGTVIALAAGLLYGAPGVHSAGILSSDGTERPGDAGMPLREVGSYADALRVWKTPEDIAVWIAAHFTYDVPRAMTLSENRKGGDERPPIHAPHELFALRTGMCVDLARFGVETLRIIDPSTDPRYLMVEFQPMWIQGNILRLHWMAMFRRKGNAFFFADTKRPGHIAGPYGGTKAFIPEYERFRERTVVSFREWASYEKQRKTRAVKRRASEGRMRTPETRRPVAE